MYFLHTYYFFSLSHIVNKIENPILGEKIAYILPTVSRKILIFNRLLTSCPGIISNEENCSRLCNFMSMRLFFIEEEDCFKRACAYFKCLIVHLKHRMDIMSLALPDVRNIQHFLVKLCYVKEDTALELMGLLKVMLLAQVGFDNNIFYVLTLINVSLVLVTVRKFSIECKL